MDEAATPRSSDPEIEAAEPAAPPVPAPPTRAGAVRAHTPPSAWPTVLGVVGLVLGGMELFGLLVTIAMMFVPAFSAQPSPTGPLHIPITAIGGVLSVMQVIVCLGLLRRAAWSIVWVKAWAWAEIAIGLAGMVNGFLVFDEAMAQARAQAGPLPGAMGAFMIGVMVFAFAWVFAPPVFVVVWLNRDRIRAEVAQWK